MNNIKLNFKNYLFYLKHCWFKRTAMCLFAWLFFVIGPLSISLNNWPFIIVMWFLIPFAVMVNSFYVKKDIQCQREKMTD